MQMLVTIIALLARDFDELILYFFGNEFLHAVLSMLEVQRYEH